MILIGFLDIILFRKKRINKLISTAESSGNVEKKKKLLKKALNIAQKINNEYRRSWAFYSIAESLTKLSEDIEDIETLQQIPNIA
ncbi:MAG: hypothetical protein ACE5J9_04215, partial [Methanosarcinales archaeon]